MRHQSDFIASSMSKFTHHIFVCNKCKPPKHLRDGKSHDSGKIRAALKKEIKRLGLKAQVRANDSGCLDQCDDGQVIVIYPQAIWYGGLLKHVRDCHLSGPFYFGWSSFIRFGSALLPRVITGERSPHIGRLR